MVTDPWKSFFWSLGVKIKIFGDFSTRNNLVPIPPPQVREQDPHSPPMNLKTGVGIVVVVLSTGL